MCGRLASSGISNLASRYRHSAWTRKRRSQSLKKYPPDVVPLSISPFFSIDEFSTPFVYLSTSHQFAYTWAPFELLSGDALFWFVTFYLGLESGSICRLVDEASSFPWIKLNIVLAGTVTTEYLPAHDRMLGAVPA